jgi:tRNA 2-selenouridine synthase
MRGNSDNHPHNSDNYKEILLSGVPLLDVRAPVEFSKGAFPNAVNLPLMNDSERQKVGTCYKNHGQSAAIELGHQLVAGAVKADRIAAWRDFALAHPQGYLYCFRSGLRSQLSQQWLEQEGGVPYPRILGGYKALRGFLLETLERAVAEGDFCVVGGLTGTGKTEVLDALSRTRAPGPIDLEGLANHRGSSFGKRATPQPAQIDFENRLAIEFLRQREAGIRQFVMEDEGRAVGSCSVPLALHERMKTCPLIWLEDSLEGRVERILSDYVVNLGAEFIALHGPATGFDLFAQRLRQSLDNIVKRLGGERHRRLAAHMDAALQAQRRSGAVDLHRAWIAGLLHEYYDPMYAFQRESKAGRIIFSGDRRSVLEFLQQR